MKPILLCALVGLSVAARAGASHNEILSSLYDAQLTRADSLIDHEIRAHPDLPDFYYLKAHYAFYARFFSQQPLSRDSILTIIEANSLRAVELAEGESAVRENKFYLGSAYGLLSRVYVMRQELWDGYWAARKSRNYLEEVLREDSTFYDAHVGLGVIEYYPSRLTGIQAALSWLAGMGGDGEKGIAHLRKAAEHGDLLRSEAMLILGYIARSFDGDFGRAGELFGALYEQFPHNEYFHTQSLQAELGIRIASEGSGFLTSDIHSVKDQYRINT